MISRHRSVGRPSRTSLDALQDAALTLGLDSFTLAAVAKEVGVAEATVYNYVHSRDELYRGACDRLSAGVDLTPDPATDTGSWMDYMDAVSARVVPLAATHPGFTEYLFYGPFGPETRHIYSTMVAEVMRRRPELDANAAYFVTSRTFMSSVTTASFPHLQDAGTWLRHSVMLGMEQQIDAGKPAR
ncbi:TetR/AcrR family transcriptional regulator [Corynebacterium variabile]|uniref:Transcriptional regulator, TetR family n=1 Tax=Corynebacterium variabile TaxID=1727 RepID=A0A0X2NK11_9CORY|nr:TetR/AcrR family transcriptional regulator [Corynebacterium variabile]CUU65089.1 transcriptional regulator, TetR family [Corynebacterium variabile]